MDTLLARIKERAFEAAWVSPKQIDFCNEVRDICETNACGRYQKSWTCPPAVGTVTELARRYQAYQNAILFSTKHDLLDEFDWEGMGAASVQHQTVEAAVRQLFVDKPHELLGAGCRQCEVCRYPLPCQNQTPPSPALEAAGIQVIDLAKKANLTYHNGSSTVTYFSLVLW